MHRSLLHVALAALSMTAPACNREQASEARTTAEGATKPATKAEAGCDAAHGQALEQELLAQCTLTPQVLVLDVPTLPWKAAPSAAPPDALRIDVDSRGVKVGGFGQPIAFEELAARFSEERERVTQLLVAQGRPRPEAWVLSMWGLATRSQVALVLQALEGAGMRQGYLRLATDPTRVLPVPRDPKQLAELETKLSEADPSQKAMLLAKELETVVPACPPVAQAFSVAAPNAPDERCAQLARDVSKGLVGCGCANETEILTLLYAVSVGEKPPERLGTSVAVTLDPDAEPLPGGMWSELAANLEQDRLGKLWVSPM